MSRFLTLNIGASKAVLAEYQLTGKNSLTLVAYGDADLPAAAEATGALEATLAPAIHRIMREKGIKPAPLVVSLNGQAVFPRFAKFPPVAAEKLEELVRYEIEQNVPFPIDEIVSDHQFTGTTADGEKAAMIVAAKVDQVRNVTDAVAAAGLAPSIVDVSPVAVYNAFRWTNPGATGCSVILDIGSRTTSLILVEGENAYGYLKSENGVHRLVRVSPFDAAGRRQTSFASIEVMPEFDDVDKVVLRDEDLEITAHRSSGAGGQHINKTDSAIRILHKPTGIVVGCQTERSQLQNKETALHMLKAKLMEIKLKERLDTIEEIQGNKTNIEWGAQIRSYVFMPYTLVKDTRTGYETGNIQAVMDGDLDGFINAYLKMIAK